VQSLLPPILLALVATVFSLPAAAVDDRDRTGTGASTEGGASLGGTGIDSGVRNPRGVDDPDKRLKLERHPKPAAEPRKPDLPERAPAERKIPPERGSAPAERGNASSGATSKGSAELSEEADKQDEEFRRKQDAERRK
jgi:hypothetical protein